MFPIKKKTGDESSDCSIRGYKYRFKTSTTCDIGGSWKSFTQFYQNGGRDYDQYRLWLKTQSATESSSSKSPPPLLELSEIKAEPFEVPSNVVTILPPPFPHAPPPPLLLPSSTAKSSKILRRLQTASRPRPVSPGPAAEPSPPLKTVSETTSRPTNGQFYVQLAICDPPNPASVPMFSWSITDVSQFIETNFENKTLARKFVEQGIDGRTLPLLTEDHLTRVFKMKLGPALRLLTVIASMCFPNSVRKPTYPSISSPPNRPSNNMSG